MNPPDYFDLLKHKARKSRMLHRAELRLTEKKTPCLCVHRESAYLEQVDLADNAEGHVHGQG